MDIFQLNFVATLHRTDLIHMAKQSGLSKEIELGQRLSFHQADMVLEGTDQQGDTHHVAAEASFTTDAPGQRPRRPERRLPHKGDRKRCPPHGGQRQQRPCRAGTGPS